MQIEVRQEELAYALTTANRAAATRTTMPILTGVLLSATTNGLRVVGHSLEVGIQVDIPAAVEREGSIVLPSSQFHDIVRRMAPGDVRIEVPVDRQVAMIRWESAEFEIHGFAAEQFPQMPDMAGQTQVRLPQATLRRVLDKAVVAAAKDESMAQALTGVQVTLEGSELTAVSSDGFRVACIRAEVGDLGLEGSPTVVIPAKALRELQRLLSSDEEATVTMTVGDRHVLFGVEDVVLAARLVEGDFPDVLSMLPSEFPIELRTDLGLFSDALERAAVIAQSQDRGSIVHLHADDSQITVRARSEDLGQLEETVPAAGLTDDLAFEIAFNVRYLLDGFGKMDGDELLIRCVGPVKPARFEVVDEPGYFYVVMPVRTSS